MVIPASVTDRNGHYLDGLSACDFDLFDNGQARRVHVDTIGDGLAPVSLVVVVEANDLSSAALAKVRKVGAMISDAVVGANGEAALIEFSNRIRVVADFTSDSDTISNAFYELRFSDEKKARMLDAIAKAVDMLAKRPAPRRANILIIGETRDRGSETKLADVIRRTQVAGVTIYSLSYSSFLTPFTAKPGDYEPPDAGQPNYLAAVSNLARLAKKNTAATLVGATGGRHMSFETQSKLDNDLIGLGKEIHSRYLISFTPDVQAGSGFHRIEIRLKDRPDAVIRARPGYWAGQQ